MAYEKKKAPDNRAYQKLKADLAAGTPARLYVFYGEEDYLRDHYLGKLRALCAGPFGDLGETVFDAEQVTAEALTEAVDSVPFGSERKLILVRDYPLMQPTGTMKERLPELLKNLPEDVCLVFYFSAAEFKPDKRLTLYKTLSQCGELVEFSRASSAELIPWLRRRFAALGKQLSPADAEYMLFYCGNSMTNLATEVDKIAAGTVGESVTREEIRRMGVRVLEAGVFDLTDRLTDGDCAGALGILRDLLALREEPIAIAAAISAQFRRLYGAKLAMEAGQGEREIAQMFGYKSTYPAQLAMRAARRRPLTQLRRMQELCLQTDSELKSGNSDPQRSLELLLLRALEASA